MPLNIPGIIEQLSDRRVDIIRGFRKRAELDYNDELRELSRLAGDRSSDQGWLADEAGYLEEFAELRDQLAIVALYRVVELMTQTILRWHYPADQIATRSLYRIDRLRAALQKDFGVAMTSLPEHQTVDELRCANNSVKHSLTVTADLAKHPGWTAGEALKGLDFHFERYARGVPLYLRGLADVVIPASPKLKSQP